MSVTKRHKIFFTSILFLLTAISLFKPFVALGLSSIFLLLTFSYVYNVKLFERVLLLGISVLVTFNLSDKLGALLLMTLLGIYFLEALIHKKRMSNIIKGRLSIIIWAFYGTLQLFWVVQTERTLSYYQTLIFGTLIILSMGLFIDSVKKIDTMYKIYGMTIVLSSVLAWYESLSGNYFNPSGVMQYNLQGVATVGFYNPNDYSLLLIVNMPLFLYWIKEYRIFYKVMAWFVIITTFYVAYVNETRSVVVVFFAFTLYFLFDVIRKKGILFFLSILSLGLVVIVVNIDIILNTFGWIKSIDTDDASLNVRMSLMQSALDVFKDNIFGVGSGNAEIYMSGMGNIHNLWIELLVNYGLLIFILLLLFWSVNIYKLFKFRKYNKYSITLLLMALIFIPTATISSSAFQFNIFWFLMGLMVSVNYITTTLVNTSE